MTDVQHRLWRRTMLPRRAEEGHRTATPLELFFDLCFVVAVALAAGQLHHAFSAGHALEALPWYLLTFFAIWWAWMNFTWFASAYDTDDGPYRLTTLVQIGGVLVLAAGIGPAFEHGDLRVIVLGYVIMRLAMVTQWLRAARSDPARRTSALRYATGITAVQVAWIARLWLPESWTAASILLLVLAELAVPVWAERAAQTTWHARHIAERYGLFTLIVLGESVLATTTAVQQAVGEGEGDLRLVGLAAAGLVTVFAMWWLYFDQPAHHLLRSLPRAIFWGYGHYAVFAAIAAVGAGLQAAVDHQTRHSEATGLATGYAVAVPVAIFLLGVWLLQVRPDAATRGRAAVVGYPLTAALTLLTPLTSAPVDATAVLLVVLVVATSIAHAARTPSHPRH